MYEDYDAMQDALSRMNKNISKSALPMVYTPMVFAVTGTGRVAQGIIEVLEQLPHVKVDPEDLPTYKSENNKEIVISIFTAKNLVKKIKDDGSPFDKAHYYSHSEEYESKFDEYLPYVDWLINGIYWEAKYPRVLSI
jgi:alpha-aminoadipic semialdehyde synthase